MTGHCRQTRSRGASMAEGHRRAAPTRERPSQPRAASSRPKPEQTAASAAGGLHTQAAFRREAQERLTYAERERRGHTGETWFPPRERAAGERRSLVDDLEEHALAPVAGGGADDRPQRPRDAPAAADHLADLVGRDV